MAARPEDIHEYEPLLTVGTVARRLGISVQTVRLYEQEGLVLPHKTRTGRRMFSLHDLDRLTCIRKMITEHGLNLSGIRRLFALIPCWHYKGGLDDDCRGCPVYYDSVGPCWTVRRVGEKCQNVDCRNCPVYQLPIRCETMKEVLFGHKRPEVSSHSPPTSSGNTTGG